MFEFRTLDRNVQSLRARRFELSLRLRDVGFGCDTSSEAVLRQVEGFLITVNGRFEKLFLGIEAPQFE